MSTKYWENEKPTTISTAKNVLQYYRDAEKLHVARPLRTDDKGTERQGKTVALDITALHECEDLNGAREVFADILAKITERMEL